jgi:DNA-directed RNA polymerase specialized sigma24 family protein
MTEQLQFMGAGQAARASARAAVEPHLRTQHRQVLLALTAAMAKGMTRRELADKTGLPVNTVNARVHELRQWKRVVTYGRRDKQSVCFLPYWLPEGAP